jgi:hypothetical protein
MSVAQVKAGPWCGAIRPGALARAIDNPLDNARIHGAPGVAIQVEVGRIGEQVALR